MSEEIHGLLTQKPTSPTPQAGDERRFSVEERVGKSGKAYTKLKGEGEGYGALYRIVKAQKTNHVDAHGNVSFNVDIMPMEQAANGNGAPNGASNVVAMPSNTLGDSLGQRLAKLGKLLKMAHDTTIEGLGTNYSGEDARTLFIQMCRDGYGSKVTLDEPVATPEEPTNEENTDDGLNL